MTKDIDAKIEIFPQDERGMFRARLLVANGNQWMPTNVTAENQVCIHAFLDVKRNAIIEGLWSELDKDESAALFRSLTNLCSVEGCERERSTRGMCRAHYMREIRREKREQGE